MPDSNVRDVYETLTNVQFCKPAWSPTDNEKLKTAIKQVGLDYKKLEQIMGRTYFELAPEV